MPNLLLSNRQILQSGFVHLTNPIKNKDASRQNRLAPQHFMIPTHDFALRAPVMLQKPRFPPCLRMASSRFLLGALNKAKKCAHCTLRFVRPFLPCLIPGIIKNSGSDHLQVKTAVLIRYDLITERNIRNRLRLLRSAVPACSMDSHRSCRLHNS